MTLFLLPAWKFQDILHSAKRNPEAIGYYCLFTSFFRAYIPTLCHHVAINSTKMNCLLYSDLFKVLVQIIEFSENIHAHNVIKFNL